MFGDSWSLCKNKALSDVGYSCYSNVSDSDWTIGWCPILKDSDQREAKKLDRASLVKNVTSPGMVLEREGFQVVEWKKCVDLK